MIEETLPTPEEVLAGCKSVLDKNQKGDYTVPAEGLYPHQWLWDSCFISIGLAEYDIERAKTELRSLLRGQWSNGMLPNMIFANGDAHKRDRNIWQSWRNPHSPDDLTTSGITQPPMLAEAVVRIGKKLDKVERRSWYQDMYPALVAYHTWLYTERDPHDEGLVLLIHPWESGLDNSPPWIDQLHVHSKPTWVRGIEKLKLDKTAVLFRRDTQHVPPGQRVSNIDALLYFNIIRRLKRKNWDIERILARSHFTFQDLTFNCIFIRANQHLKSIAKTIGHHLPEDLEENMKRSEDALDNLWDGFYKQYYSRTFITRKLVKEPSLAALMPLYSGAIDQERAEELVKLLKSPSKFGAKYPVPSVPMDSSWYKEFGYWQGPTWINTNWLITDGLRRYGFDKEAEKIENSSIELVTKNGPHEYFSAKNGKPAGARNFSWSASLIIEMLSRKKNVKKES
ncbi:glycoside hydrolase [Candidatus Saccharibacteria bacterium]|nr:glycoside hydrolase [Candidatus Saccharibacteria bacterium]